MANGYTVWLCLDATVHVSKCRSCLEGCTPWLFADVMVHVSLPGGSRWELKLSSGCPCSLTALVSDDSSKRDDEWASNAPELAVRSCFSRS